MSRDPIFDAYQRFKHLDRVVNDPLLMDDTLQNHMLRGCWQAIKDDLRKRGCAEIIREEVDGND